MTGFTSFTWPEYSPISSSVSEVRRSSSARHCRADTVLVTRMSVVVLETAIAPAPTRVLPAPQGSTTTPEPWSKKLFTASFWYARSAQPPSWSRSISCGVPGVYPARSSAGQPIFRSSCLSSPRAHCCITKLFVAALLEQEVRDLLAARDLGEHGGVGGGEDERALVVALDHESAVPPHRLRHVGGDRLRDGELRPALEGGEHVFRGVPGRPRVPEPESGDAVGVDVLGRAFELGEHGEVVPRVLRERMRDLEQHRAVALHDQGAGDAVLRGLGCGR